MANTKLRCIFFLLAVSYVMSDRFVGGKELVKHKGTVKTIEVIMNINYSFLNFILILILDNLLLSSFSFWWLYIFEKISGLLAYLWSSKIFAG
jgi:hypothetical protein